MSKAIHRNHPAQPDVLPFTLTAVRARPHIPPASRAVPSRREEIVYRVNEDYKFLFRMMFQAIAFFDRCEDCETLIDAGKMFQYLAEVAEDAVEEAWEAY